MNWRKSSYSHGNGGNCLEVAWRKSSHSTGNGGACLEVAAPSAILIRDSKLAASPTCPVLAIDRETWRGFLTAIAAR